MNGGAAVTDMDLTPVILRMSEQLGRIEAKLEEHNKFDARLKAASARAEEGFDLATAAKAIAQSTRAKVNGALGLIGAGVVGLVFDWIRKRLLG